MSDWESLTSKTPLRPVDPDDMRVGPDFAGHCRPSGRPWRPHDGHRCEVGRAALQSKRGRPCRFLQDSVASGTHSARHAERLVGRAKNSATASLRLPRPTRCRRASRVSIPTPSLIDCDPALPNAHSASELTSRPQSWRPIRTPTWLQCRLAGSLVFDRPRPHCR